MCGPSPIDTNPLAGTGPAARRFQRIVLAALLIAARPASLAAQSSSPPPARGVPAAMADGQRIEWSDLLPLLVEAAGGGILEETVLDRALAAECERCRIAVGEADVGAERMQLAKTLAAAAGAPESEGETLIASVRQRRGLGDLRFAALLKRNAMLRALVRSGSGPESVPPITDADLSHAYSLKFGPRVRARLIVVRGAQAAAEVVRRVRGDGVNLPAEGFGEVASQVSIDPSAPRGGLLDPFSLDDGNYPVAVRRALTNMRPAEVSDPIEVTWGIGEIGYAVVKLEERLEGSARAPTPAEAEPDLRAEIQLVRERAAMDRLARRLVAGAKVTIFDRALDRSWSSRAEADR